MSGTPGPSSGQPDQPPVVEIDPTVPNPARVWNYWLGGEHNFAADRAAGDRIGGDSPVVAGNARAFRSFVGCAVRYLAAEVQLRQFLDVGAGLPAVDSTHEVAQRAAPDSRVVYVDNDPVVLAHARELLVGQPEGTTAYLAGDLHDTASVLGAAREAMDFAQPAGLILSGILGHVELTAARSVVRRLVYELAPGSYLVVCDAAGDGATEQRQYDVLRREGWGRYFLRSPDEIAAFLEGLDIVEPGVVPCLEWRPEEGSSGSLGMVRAVGGVARKP